MSVRSSKQPRAAAWASRWVMVVLAVSAALTALSGLLLAFSLQDAEALESPLIMSVARQLLISPWELYGPFGAGNLLVLIHAPLYYRLAALLAWPINRTGLQPMVAALVAGRSLSLLGLAVTLTAAYRLARLDGAPRRAGWFAMFLIAAAPVVGVIPFAVRPDMMGAALQTTGVLLVLSVLRSARPGRAMLPAAFGLFGLAICIKQHFIVGPLVSTCLLLAACRRGQVAFRLIVGSLLTGLTLALVVFGTEELATGGRMSQAVFVAAANAARVHPADWFRTEVVLLAVIGRSTGLITLLTASGLALVPVHANLGRRALVAAGTILVGLIFVLANLQVVVAIAQNVAFSLFAVIAAAVIILPLCALLEPRSLARGRLDLALWFYLAGELAWLFVLCGSSTGAWVNYAIPSTVFASVLTARTLDRALGEVVSLGRLLPIAVAASILPIGVAVDPFTSANRRSIERMAIARIFQEIGRPSGALSSGRRLLKSSERSAGPGPSSSSSAAPAITEFSAGLTSSTTTGSTPTSSRSIWPTPDRTEFFFVGRPGDNRVFGRLDLVYDDWLYPVFESIHLAEPRSNWLRRALATGPVHFVVNTSDSPEIEGIGLTLPQLGYSRRIHAGPFFVWERIRPSTGAEKGISPNTVGDGGPHYWTYPLSYHGAQLLLEEQGDR